MKIKSSVEKDREFYELIASENSYLSTEKEINNLKKENLNLQKKLAKYEAFFEDCKALKKFKFPS